MLGIGIGIIIATLLMSLAPPNKQFTDEQVELRARELGMEYTEEFKVISKDVEQ
ncbi:hypothetical protein [Clostridium thermarum]|uniref:hypothetical protein n=1 Tax=Clostridium thermarum TaxID=1716543 RepID=UPI001FA99BF3|nr:hypothetical protein [Clostridium thermarum]